MVPAFDAVFDGRRQERGEAMNRRLYVGGLDYGVDDEALGDLFGNHGSVEEAVVVKDRDSGRSKGFGFVTMETEEGARDAKSALDGHKWFGRTLRVDEAREKFRDGERDRGRG